ncbi:class IV adenylate cyclase [bacterium]|nr:class IV adenylate cyclase [bacterium]
MARNIEIKAHISQVTDLMKRVAELADSGPEELLQVDTFFNCPVGRLKLRTGGGGEGELIFYQRANQAGPKESVYERIPISNPDNLRRTLSLAYGERGCVRKRRILFLIGRTRVHLDTVDQLGNFLELETVLAEGETAAKGMAEAGKLMKELGICDDQLIEGAYFDLLENKLHHQPPDENGRI